MTCDFRPFPDNRAYGHWTCERQRLHLGRHRFLNYTFPRIPCVWHLRRLWRSFQADQRMRRSRISKPGYGYRRALYPTKYEPAETAP